MREQKKRRVRELRCGCIDRLLSGEGSGARIQSTGRRKRGVSRDSHDPQPVDMLSQRSFTSIKLPRKRPVDHYDGLRIGPIGVGDSAASEDGNLERIEVAGGNID